MKTQHHRIRPIIMIVAFAGVLVLALLLFLDLPVSAIQRDLSFYKGDLEELHSGFDYAAWYEQETGYVPDENYFGAYVVEAVGDDLYLGYGTGRPAEFDGALLAMTDGSVITAVSPLTEQGFIDIDAVDGTLYIPGADPCCGDGWELGNLYVKSPTLPITKHRNLPNVIHTWGTWFDTEKDILYAATSAHLGDNETWTGAVFSSTTQGADWVSVGNHEDGLGNYRTYDIIGFANRLYAVWNDIPAVSTDIYYSCGLAVSADEGLTWTRITDPNLQPLACRARLHIWQNQLLALSDDQKTILAIAEDEQMTEHRLTDFRVSAWSYHPFDHDNNGYLYTIGEYGEVLRTANLTDWETITRTRLDLFSIAYWPAQDKLVLSERANGRLWTLDLATATPTPTPPLASAKNVIILIADGWGANHIAATNDYTNATPSYQRWPRYWISTYPAGGSYDPQLAWTDFGYALSNPTDSAAAATALFTGKKTKNGRIAVNEDASSRFSTISEKAQAFNKAVGTVTSVQIGHATPGAWMSHNAARGNGYAIVDEGLWGDPNTTGTETDNGRYAGGFGTSQPQDVVIGGGHPNWNTSYITTTMRDKLNIESGTLGNFLFVERIAGSEDGGTRLLNAANTITTTRLAGLFGGSSGNLGYRLADGSGQNPENPTLAEMTTAALTVLTRSPEGFVLMVEGGAVDWGSHQNNMDRMIGEMIGFNEAVQTVVDWVETEGNGSNWDNTLVIITGDHETGYLTASPNLLPDKPLGNVNPNTVALEKEVTSTGHRASWVDGNNNNEIDEGERVYWAWNSGSHSNSLIPLYAYGIGAKFVTIFATNYDPVRGAFLDNTNVYHLVGNVLRQLSYLPLISS